MTPEEREARLEEIHAKDPDSITLDEKFLLSELHLARAERDEALKTFRDCTGSDHHQEMVKERDAAISRTDELLELSIRSENRALLAKDEALENAAKVVETRANRAFLPSEPMEAIRRELLGGATDIRALKTGGGT